MTIILFKKKMIISEKQNPEELTQLHAKKAS